MTLMFCSRNADFDSILSRVSLMKSCKDFWHISILALQHVQIAVYEGHNMQANNV